MTPQGLLFTHEALLDALDEDLSRFPQIKGAGNLFPLSSASPNLQDAQPPLPFVRIHSGTTLWHEIITKIAPWELFSQ